MGRAAVTHLPAVINPHVQAMKRRCLTAEHLARLLCQAWGFEPDERNADGVPFWRFYVEQAHGVLDLVNKGKTA